MLKNIQFAILLFVPTTTAKQSLQVDAQKANVVKELITSHMGTVVPSSHSDWDYAVTSQESIRLLVAQDPQLDQFQNKSLSQLITLELLQGFLGSSEDKIATKVLLGVFNAKNVELSFEKLPARLLSQETWNRKNVASILYAFESMWQLEAPENFFQHEFGRAGQLLWFLHSLVKNSKKDGGYSLLSQTFSTKLSKTEVEFTQTRMNSGFDQLPLGCWLCTMEYLVQSEVRCMIATCKLFRSLGKYVQNCFYKSLCFRIVKSTPYLAKNAPRKKNLKLTTLYSERDYFAMASNQLFPMIISAYDAYRPQNSLRELLPYIYLDIQKKEKDDAPVGGTFFGGLPDLAVGLRWPQNYGFLCQINCADICELFGARNSIPTYGIFYFFIKTVDRSISMLYSDSDHPSQLIENAHYPYGPVPEFFPRAKMKALDMVKLFDSGEHSIDMQDQIGFGNCQYERDQYPKLYIHCPEVFWMSFVQM